MSEANRTRTPMCAICRCALRPEEPKVRCGSCKAVYHKECWVENGGCAVYGCKQVPPTEHRESVEIPVSYWGQEYKPCPSCGQQILAAAFRCRNCGATFSSMRPEDSQGYRERVDIEKRLPALRRSVIWLFALCVVPCAAPFAVLFGGIWYASHKKEIQALPSLYQGLSKIALTVGIVQIVMIAVMGFLFATFRG